MDQELVVTLTRLREAAELYRQLAIARRHREQADARTADLEAASDEWADDIAGAVAAERRQQGETGALEDALAALEANLRDRRGREARDAGTAAALNHEIEALERRQKELESRLLERWQQDEGLAQIRAVDLHEATAARARLAARQAGMEQRRRQAELAAPEILTELEQLGCRLPARIAGRLAQVARRHPDPVADLVQGACGGCGQILPPVDALAADREARLVSCEGCGRYVVARSSRRTR